MQNVPALLLCSRPCFSRAKASRPVNYSAEVMSSTRVEMGLLGSVDLSIFFFFPYFLLVMCYLRYTKVWNRTQK